MSALLQAGYDAFKALPGASSSLFPSLVALGSFHLFCALHTVDDLWRLQRAGVWDTLVHCAVPQFAAHMVVNTAAWLVLANVLEPNVLPILAPSPAEFAGGLLGCYIVGDFLIYWEHVFMHRIQWLRQNIHSTHHFFTSPLFSWHAGWVHPFEIAVAIVCELAYPYSMGLHPFTLWVFIATWVFWLVEEHSGKEVWWSLSKILPWGIGGGSEPHGLHHEPLLTRNFAFVFSVWDHIFGTYAAPSKSKKSIDIVRKDCAIYMKSAHTPHSIL